jgi:hypothetical protein
MARAGRTVGWSTGLSPPAAVLSSYFPEQREAAVIEMIKRNPALRDEKNERRITGLPVDSQL